MLQLPYTDDLTQAGIDYLCRQLHHVGVRHRNLDFNALRQQVAEKAAELALIRYLTAQDVPHEVSAVRSMVSHATSVRLGGRPLFLHLELVSQPRLIERLMKEPHEQVERPLHWSTASREDGQTLEGGHIAARLLGEVTKGPRDVRDPPFPDAATGC